MIFTSLPLIPYLHSVEDVIFIAAIFLRVSGLFLIAPLIDNKQLPHSVRTWLVLFITVIIAFVLYPEYRSPAAPFHLDAIESKAPFIGINWVLLALKELATGYLIGMCYALIFEALSLAGYLVSNISGLSFSDMVDPVTNNSQGTLNQVMILAATLFLLATDRHHAFFYALKLSFETIPLGHYEMSYTALQHIIAGSSHVFTYGLQLAAFPLAVLLLVTVGLGFMAKVMPEMNIFVLAFPIKISIGYYALIFSLTYFPLIVQHAFIEYGNLVSLLLTALTKNPHLS